MPDLSLPEALFLTAGVTGFTTFGCCLVYQITYAESFMPVWLERLLLLALNAKDRALIVAADALLAASLYLNSPAKKGALR